MKQIITRVEEPLAAAVKEHAALRGESVNSFVTRLLREAVDGRQAWKSNGIVAGRLVSRAAGHSPGVHAEVSTPGGYASELISAERDQR